MKQLTLIFLFLAGAVRVFATTYASDGSQADVNAKIAGATTGDVVTIPAGSFTWGASSSQVTVNKAITLQGAGTGSTTIVLSTTGNTGAGGVIAISAAAHVKDFSITGAINGSLAVTPVVATGDGYAMGNIIYTGPAATGYFAYCAGGYGVFYSSTFNINHGSSQVFQVRGPNTNWDVAHTMGTANAVYVEDCTFVGGCTASVTTGGAGRAVARFNTFGSMPLDAHMIETETSVSGTPHGSRQFEGYNNTWPTHDWVDSFWIVGGTGMFFDNTVATGTGMWARFYEYGAATGLTVPGPGWIPTPAHLPIPDQLGTGAYPQSAGQEPVYWFNNQQASGADKAPIGATVDASAISAYGSTFYMWASEGSPSMLSDGVDMVIGVKGGSFPSTTKVGRGTKAAMNASSPTAARQAWWVTDEGSWRSGFPGTSGQLYQWNGSAWVLYYTPYTYPHPLRSGGGGGSTGNVTVTGRLKSATLRFQ